MVPLREQRVALLEGMMSHYSDAWTDIPEFGTPCVRCIYHPRPGAYAVFYDAQHRIAVVQTPMGGLLPGGGAIPGDTPEETLRREVQEECGYAITGLRKLGEAVEYVYAAAEQRYFRKQGVFFVAQLEVRLAHPSKGDHTLRWYAPGEAITDLSHQSHICVVRRVAPARSGAVLPKSTQSANLAA